jgi:hypothetical protein
VKIVFSTEDDLEYQEAATRLSDAGIPVTEPSKYSELAGYMVGPRSRVLCVWLDHQYEDAIRLLADPNHVVKNPVDWEEFERVQAVVRENHETTIKKTSERVLNWLFTGVLVAAVVFGLYRVVH